MQQWTWLGLRVFTRETCSLHPLNVSFHENWRPAKVAAGAEDFLTLSVCLCIYLSISLFIYLPIIYLSIPLSLYFFLYLLFCQSTVLGIQFRTLCVAGKCSTTHSLCKPSHILCETHYRIDYIPATRERENLIKQK